MTTDKHLRALERLYHAAPINRSFPSKLSLPALGESRLEFEVSEEHFHAAGAAHGTIYFKMLDDAAFYAVNTAVEDVFILTTAFNLHMERPVPAGRVWAEGRMVSGRRRLFVGESRLLTEDGEEIARGTGTFMRSKIPLVTLTGYRESDDMAGDSN
ncbi:thioesterase [Pacificimonas flava]|uniref:Thioesterase n=2 Tax=Pacificimonas TaxID=1960290 RepID=A0A219B2W0_9SPHN|nr:MULTISPECIES: PaaI family thioesterase [Pacificimonas]MBZ6377638.1 PaaI family thioesterase [Pacificimonas aurantium]OWV32675.1 thioesterase [Pacificimonas flava]